MSTHSKATALPVALMEFQKMRKTAKELFAPPIARTVSEPAVVTADGKLVVPTPTMVADVVVQDGKLTLHCDDAYGENPLSVAGFADGDQVIVIRYTKKHQQ
jgi:hypothetical protein